MPASARTVNRGEPRPALISRAELARLTGVSKPAITKACRSALAPALIGARLDPEHPAVRAYLARHDLAAPERRAVRATEALLVELEREHEWIARRLACMWRALSRLKARE